MEIRRNVPLAPWTTIRLGGPAALFAETASEAEMVELLADTRADVFVLGGGSNVVVADDGFPGLVVRIAMRGVDVVVREGRVQLDVAAGEAFDEVVARAVSEGWSGLECLSGIPGLVGATPIQNVGAYGQEVADTIVSVRAWDRQLGAFVELDSEACRFGYRSSVFRGSQRYIVTRVRFSLRKAAQSAPIRYAELGRALSVPEGGSAPLARVRDVVIALRRTKGMVCDPQDPESVSAGSFFVNPVVSSTTRDELEQVWRARGDLREADAFPGFASGGSSWKIPAAWLIERAGFPKGTSRGAVGVSARHALALVNRGGSTNQLLALEEEIRAAVQARFGLVLQREPILVGV